MSEKETINYELAVRKLKSFIDWVNADTNLPTLEELEGNLVDSYDFDDVEVIEFDDEDILDIQETAESKVGDLDEEFDYSEMFASKGRNAQKSAEAKLVSWKLFVAKMKRLPRTRLVFQIFSVLLTVTIIAILLITEFDMPAFGNPNNPTANEVYTRYIEQGVADTGATNIVAAMILDYRAFDTLGEAFVLLTAVIAVVMLIRTPGVAAPKSKIDMAEQPFMLKYAVMLVVPFVIVFGIYILLNGHLSPGGGFSGGAVLGAGISLYAASYGIEKVRTIFTFKTFVICSVSALSFYSLAKGFSFIMGASGLSTGIPLGTPGNLLSAGLVMPLNVSVGFVVACSAYGLYALFSEGEV